MKKTITTCWYRPAVLFLLLLAAISTAATVHATQKTLSQNEVGVLIEQTFNIMDSHYIDADIVNKLRTVIHNRLQLGAYKDVTELEEFADVVGGDIRSISGDKHLSLFTVHPNEEVTHILSHSEGKLTYNYAFEEVRYLDGNIGYLKFNKFHPDENARGVFEAAFQFLKQSDGLIIDLRDTIGGSPYLVKYMLSHFFAEGTPLWEVRDRNDKVLDAVVVDDEFAIDSRYGDKPVWILTSYDTASASELFAGVMQANDKAVLVGDVTAGAGYYVGVRNITGELVFRISLSKPVISVSQKNWEKTGLEPDVEVPQMDAFNKAFALAMDR